MKMKRTANKLWCELRADDLTLFAMLTAPIELYR